MSGFLDDLDALLLSSAYVLVILALAEWLRRRGCDGRITRKIVHVGVGTWVGPTYLLYEHRMWAVLPAIVFVAVNSFSYRTGLIASVEGEERNVGTILYPASVAAALAVFWEPAIAWIGLAAILTMAWGDAAASLVGRRWGRRVYRVAGHSRTLEGSLAMFVVSVLAVLVAHATLAGPSESIWAAALLAAVAATLVEAVSLWGVDNFLVPAVTAGALWWMRTAS